MATTALILTALFPIAVLIFYICYKDKNNPEPTKELIKTFLIGILTIPLSFCISIPFSSIGLYSMTPTTILGSISTSFFGAAIPEEIAKFVILWFILRKNPFFDEKMDGIVYAVFVSLSFAAIENIMYIIGNADSFLSIGISRAIFAVPGHFCFGILMGYYYSLAKFDSVNKTKNRILILAAPILAHGIYDSLLFMIGVTPEISGFLSIIFLVFCHKTWKYGSRSIQEHLKRDNIIL